MYRKQAPDEDPPAVRWLPFQLNPDVPEAGIARAQYLERKFGRGAARDYSHLVAIGKELGIDFAFDKITVQPNTLAAHRLLLYAARLEREDQVAESLFRAYFQEGAAIGDATVLADIGGRAGLERAAVGAYLASDQDRDTVLQSDIEARHAGIDGVPFFIFNRRVTVSGAHEPEALLQAMREAIEDGAARPSSA